MPSLSFLTIFGLIVLLFLLISVFLLFPLGFVELFDSLYDVLASFNFYGFCIEIWSITTGGPTKDSQGYSSPTLSKIRVGGTQIQQIAW